MNKLLVVSDYEHCYDFALTLVNELSKKNLDVCYLIYDSNDYSESSYLTKLNPPIQNKPIFIKQDDIKEISALLTNKAFDYLLVNDQLDIQMLNFLITKAQSSNIKVIFNPLSYDLDNFLPKCDYSFFASIDYLICAQRNLEYLMNQKITSLPLLRVSASQLVELGCHNVLVLTNDGCLYRTTKHYNFIASKILSSWLYQVYFIINLVDSLENNQPIETAISSSLELLQTN
jgi:hypothetical protein